MTYDDIWRQLSAIYQPGEAKAIARQLLEDMFDLSFADILCGGIEQLDTDSRQRLSTAIGRLMKNEPLQYVVGFGYFLGHRFDVRPGVLIPRPETEWLVSKAVDDATTRYSHGGTRQRILDIGTGSGCIATSIWLAANNSTRRCDTYVEAWDISPDALDIAKVNINRLNANVTVKMRDALKAANSTTDNGTWDIIVSNPPYICQQEKKDMAANVLDFEPHGALFVPDNDPLLFYRAISRYAEKALNKGGSLLFECNTRYAHHTALMMQEMGFVDVDTVDDCFGMPRFAVGRKQGDN